MPEPTRREMLCAGAITMAASAGAAVATPRAARAACPSTPPSQWDNEYNFGHTILFMQEYHLATMDILGSQGAELDQIGELTSRAASVIRAGGTIWTSMNVGHMPIDEQKETRRGSPRIMKDHRDFGPLKKGDMVFTNFCNRQVQAARDRGVYVVCVTTNYQNNEFRPAGFTESSRDNPDRLMLKDVSNEILHSHIPYYQGLVHAPEIPEFTICPSTTTGSGSIHWMLNAEIANKLADPNAPAVDKSAEYLRILTERVARISDHTDRIREVAVTMARRIRDGGRWFVRSIEHPGFEIEMSGVASGPMIVNHGDWEATKERNVMLIAAISPAHRQEVQLARDKQIEGAYVIGIGPSSVDGDVPPGRLNDVADAGFDNFSPESGGVIRISGQKETICPTSGIVGNVIQQMICAQWCDEMVRRGSVPYFWMGVFQKGGQEYDDGIHPFFLLQGF